MTQCKEHGRLDERYKVCTADVKEIKKDIKDLRRQVNIWIGVIAGLTAIPLLVKLFSFFEPVARAMGD